MFRKDQIGYKALLLLLAAGAAGAAWAGEVRGVVLDDVGKPVYGATVSVSRASGNETRTAQSVADGSFDFRDLAPGVFRVCASVPDSSLLDPCTWGPYQEVALADDEAVATYNMTLARGAVVSVSVEDPDGLISPAEGEESLMVVIASEDGQFLPMSRRVSDAHGYQYQLLVPPGKDCVLNLYTRGITLSGNGGPGVDPGAPIPVKAFAGARIGMRFRAARATQ